MGPPGDIFHGPCLDCEPKLQHIGNPGVVGFEVCISCAAERPRWIDVEEAVTHIRLNARQHLLCRAHINWAKLLAR